MAKFNLDIKTLEYVDFDHLPEDMKLKFWHSKYYNRVAMERLNNIRFS